MESKRVFFAAHLSSETQSLFWWTLSSGRTNGYKDVSHQIPPIFWATSSSFKRWSVPLNHVYESVDDRYRSRPCIATLASVLWKPKIHTPPRKLRWLAGKNPHFFEIGDTSWNGWFFSISSLVFRGSVHLHTTYPSTSQEDEEDASENDPASGIFEATFWAADGLPENPIMLSQLVATWHLLDLFGGVMVEQKTAYFVGLKFWTLD